MKNTLFNAQPVPYQPNTHRENTIQTKSTSCKTNPSSQAIAFTPQKYNFLYLKTDNNYFFAKKRINTQQDSAQIQLLIKNIIFTTTEYFLLTSGPV